jgi:DNA-binding MarR family transcriptional regulator
MGKLKDEPKAIKIAATGKIQIERDVFLTLQRTADTLMREFEEILKPANLSHTQYNVLRILRTSKETGLACHEITDRMSTHDPDMTRLLDRLEDRKLLARSRERDDRRVIRVRISGDGLSLLRNLDEPVRQSHRRQLGHIGERRLRVLNKLLLNLRERAK